MAEQHVTYKEVRQGYFDCRRHKRKSPEAIEYEVEYEINNHELMDDLNGGTYAIGRAKRFAVPLPTVREVYAYKFRDRVVEHILANRILPILEEYFIPDTYSCRKGKGVQYGVLRIAEQIAAIGKNCVCVHLDISGYFPSMERQVVWDTIEPVIRAGWLYDDDVEWWLGLLRMFVFHDPSVDCIECGDIELLRRVPERRVLTHEKGEPIGNLLNQIFAIVYLTPIDKWLCSVLQGYGRYADDMRLLDEDKAKILSVLPELRHRLAAIGLTLNERKTIIQRADKGVLFTGYVIKPWGIYSGKRLVKNALACSREVESIEKHLRRINSYLGFLKHTLSYAIRFKIWDNTCERYRGIFAKSHLCSIHQTKSSTI